MSTHYMDQESASYFVECDWLHKDFTIDQPITNLIHFIL